MFEQEPSHGTELETARGPCECNRCSIVRRLVQARQGQLLINVQVTRHGVYAISSSVRSGWQICVFETPVGRCCSDLLGRTAWQDIATRAAPHPLVSSYSSICTSILKRTTPLKDSYLMPQCPYSARLAVQSLSPQISASACPDMHQFTGTGSNSK